jgi:hypothetical protein
LAIELSTNRLRRHRSGAGVSRGLPHGLFESRDLVAAGARLRRCDTEDQARTNDQGCDKSSVHD